MKIHERKTYGLPEGGHGHCKLSEKRNLPSLILDLISASSSESSSLIEKNIKKVAVVGCDALSVETGIKSL